uniref:Uncharacterized protein n=1 Tax=Trichogramma kaykai TaxID=54128 RepID=A0ABD2XDD7_9HYME
MSHKNSTPLHALAQLCVCYCLDLCTDTTDCNERRPVDEIVNMLIKKGANIEARNSDGYTSLEFAASRLDYELVRTLLKHGASLNSFDVNMLINDYHTVLGVRSSPITLHIVEMIRLLLSNGFIMDFDVRLKILKFWMTVRRHDIKYLIPDIHDFFMKQEDVDYLQKICEQFRLKVPEYLKRQNAENFTNKLEIEVTKMKSILQSDPENIELGYQDYFYLANNLLFPEDFRRACVVSMATKWVQLYPILKRNSK